MFWTEGSYMPQYLRSETTERSDRAVNQKSKMSGAFINVTCLVICMCSVPQGPTMLEEQEMWISFTEYMLDNLKHLLPNMYTYESASNSPVSIYFQLMTSECRKRWWIIILVCETLRDVFLCLRLSMCLRRGETPLLSVSSSCLSQRPGIDVKHKHTQQTDAGQITNSHKLFLVINILWSACKSSIFMLVMCVFERSKSPKIGRLGHLRWRITNFWRKFGSCTGEVEVVEEPYVAGDGLQQSQQTVRVTGREWGLVRSPENNGAGEGLVRVTTDDEGWWGSPQTMRDGEGHHMMMMHAYDYEDKADADSDSEADWNKTCHLHSISVSLLFWCLLCLVML